MDQHERLEARDLLRAIEGPSTAVSSLFGEGGGEQELRIRVLKHLAYGGDAPVTT